MNKSMKDELKGKFHEVKGKIKEEAGKVTNNSDLKVEGHAEKLAAKSKRSSARWSTYWRSRYD